MSQEQAVHEQAVATEPLRTNGENGGFASVQRGEALSSSLIQSPSELDGLRASWDALAVAVRSPFGCPAWAEAWWRHLAPDRARLAVVAVHAGDELVGLAPLYATRRFGVTELRLLSGGLASRLGILAAPGQEPEVAAAIAGALADLDPRPDIFRWEAVDAASPWPGLQSADHPFGSSATRLQKESTRSAPVLHLSQASYEEWLAGKGGKFRRELRRRQRKIEAEDAVIRSADRSSLRRDLEAFERLHLARWDGRGGSAIPAEAIDMLEDVGNALIDAGRFRLWMIDGPDGEAISAQVYVAAGGEVAFWNLGFDERWGKYAPGTLTTLAAIEDAFGRDDELLDFGGGEGSYKERLTDEDRPVMWCTSYRRGPRYPLARLRRLPGQVARRGSHTVRERLGPDRFNRLRGLLVLSR
jgi:CelD/BcsL family acetyltransferase involved in cellulose biosynthesis